MNLGFLCVLWCWFGVMRILCICLVGFGNFCVVFEMLWFFIFRGGVVLFLGVYWLNEEGLVGLCFWEVLFLLEFCFLDFELLGGF